jgi:hypothetical protein
MRRALPFAAAAADVDFDALAACIWLQHIAIAVYMYVIFSA